jgi:hypothetical protein
MSWEGCARWDVEKECSVSVRIRFPHVRLKTSHELMMFWQKTLHWCIVLCLVYRDLSHNHLNGSIPANLGELPRLEKLWAFSISLKAFDVHCQLCCMQWINCQYLSLFLLPPNVIMTSLVSTESSSTHSDRFWQCAGILMTILWLGRCLPVLVLVHCGVQVSSTHDDALSQCLFFTICFFYVWVSSNVNCLEQCFCFWGIFASSLQKEKLVQQIQKWLLWEFAK